MALTFVTPSSPSYKSQVTGRKQAMQPAGLSPSGLRLANSWRHRRILKPWEAMVLLLSMPITILQVYYDKSPNL